MRKFSILAAVAPIALLAACADNEAEDTAMADDEMATADMETNSTADMGNTAPSTATRLDDAGDYSGTYSYNAPDGSTQDLRLNASDNTYEYTRPDGTMATGSYERNEDGYRIWIRDYYGDPAWFSFSNDQLVRMNQDTQVTADTDFSMQDSGSADRAVFSRSPELGSPVAPQN